MIAPTGNGSLSRVAVSALLLAMATPLLAGEVQLSGRVTGRDGIGLGGVTVVLIALGSSMIPGKGSGFGVESEGGLARVARTKVDGAFTAVIPPGRYHVAAFKSGFGAALVEVNTRVRTLVEVRLEEASRAIFGDLPEGESPAGAGLGWILRGDSGDILRQAGGGAGIATIAGSDLEDRSRRASSWLRAVLQPIDGELVQRFSGADLLGNEAAGQGDLSGHTTDLSLRGLIGEQGAWRFEGLVGRLATGSGDAPGAARQGRSADRMQVGFDYRLGAQDNLKGDLRYGTARYVVDPNGETTAATDQDQTHLGVSSRWEKILGETALLHVEGAYVQTMVRIPRSGGTTFADLSGDPGTPSQLVDRSSLASAGLAFGSGDHQLDFGIRAKSYSYPLRDRGVLLYSLDDSPTLTEPGESGSALSLYGTDDWRIGHRSIVRYGLRYHSSVSAGGSYFVPRVGVTLEPPEAGGTVLQSMVLYRFDDPGLSSLYTSAEERRTGERRDVGRLGYALGVERRQENRLRFAATYSYRPFEEGTEGEESGVLGPGAWGDALIFLTDGAAGRHEMALEVGQRFGGIQGSLSESVGRVDGRLTPALEEAPVQVLSLGEVRYSLTRLRARYEPTDTEIRIDYRRVEAETSPGDPAAALEAMDYQRLDLALAQDLRFLRRVQSARFKVLMAYQGLVYGSSDSRSGGLPVVGPAVTSRFTGGVDIRF
jgi:hypothetical protein